MKRILLAGLLAVPLWAANGQTASADPGCHHPGVCYHKFQPKIVIPVPLLPAFKPSISFYCPECNKSCVGKACSHLGCALGCKKCCHAHSGPAAPYYAYWPGSDGPYMGGPYGAPGPYASSFNSMPHSTSVPGVPSYWYGH